MVVDAWITNLPESQYVRVTWSQSYYDAVTPPGVEGALVFVTDEDGEQYNFVESLAMLNRFIATFRKSINSDRIQN